MFADFLELLLAYLRLSPDQTQAAPSNATLGGGKARLVAEADGGCDLLLCH